MFYEWVAEGAAFGIKAFFAVAVFAMICAAVLGILGLVGRMFGDGNGRTR